MTQLWEFSSSGGTATAGLTASMPSSRKRWQEYDQSKAAMSALRTMVGAPDSSQDGDLSVTRSSRSGTISGHFTPIAYTPGAQSVGHSPRTSFSAAASGSSTPTAVSSAIAASSGYATPGSLLFAAATPAGGLTPVAESPGGSAVKAARGRLSPSKLSGAVPFGPPATSSLSSSSAAAAASEAATAERTADSATINAVLREAQRTGAVGEQQSALDAALGYTPKAASAAAAAAAAAGEAGAAAAREERVSVVIRVVDRRAKRVAVQLRVLPGAYEFGREAGGRGDQDPPVTNCWATLRLLTRALGFGGCS